MGAMDSVDREVLQSVFASRMTLAKMTEDEAVDEMRRDWKKNLAWVNSSATKQGSFLWYVDEINESSGMDLDPSAIRRAIKERRK